MKIKILTYCLGFVLIGLALVQTSSASTKGSRTVSKGFTLEKSFHNNFKNDNIGGSTNYNSQTANIISIFHSYSLSPDFLSGKIVARQENIFRTNRWFNTNLKI